MSRVGKVPIVVPDKVTVQVKGSTVEVKGPAGTMSKHVPEGISVQVQDKVVNVSRKDDSLPNISPLHGLTRTLLSNMIQGAVQPWKKDLEIHGVGFRATKAGQVLNLQLGFSHPVSFQVPQTVQFAVDAKQTYVSLSCPDKELLGITAAKIRTLRPPEPYKGKGIRYAGEKILRKAGKAAGAAGSTGGKK